jgi:hypothetical protein
LNIARIPSFRAAGVKDDPLVSSSIRSLTIGGQALGSVGGADHYGIVAENVGALKIGDTPISLKPGGGSDNFFVGVTRDFKVHEL